MLENPPCDIERVKSSAETSSVHQLLTKAYAVGLSAGRGVASPHLAPDPIPLCCAFHFLSALNTPRRWRAKQELMELGRDSSTRAPKAIPSPASSTTEKEKKLEPKSKSKTVLTASTARVIPPATRELRRKAGKCHFTERSSKRTCVL